MTMNRRAICIKEFHRFKNIHFYPLKIPNGYPEVGEIYTVINIQDGDPNLGQAGRTFYEIEGLPVYWGNNVSGWASHYFRLFDEPDPREKRQIEINKEITRVTKPQLA